MSILKEVIVYLFAKEREAKKEKVAREEEENKDVDNEEKGTWSKLLLIIQRFQKSYQADENKLGLIMLSKVNVKIHLNLFYET